MREALHIQNAFFERPAWNARSSAGQHIVQAADLQPPTAHRCHAAWPLLASGKGSMRSADRRQTLVASSIDQQITCQLSTLLQFVAGPRLADSNRI